MFSIGQTHNQFVYHLSQLSATLSSRRSPIPLSSSTNKSSSSNRSTSKGNSTWPGGGGEVILLDSLLETLHNCTELPIGDLVRANFSPTDLLKCFMKPNLNRNGSLRPSWMVSYVSADSFHENKCGVSLSQLESFHKLSPEKIAVCIPLLSKATLLKPQMLWFQGQHVRGFKTKIGLQDELRRNPSVSTRLRSLLRNKMPSREKTELDTDKLRGMLSEESLSNSEKQRIKVAFAEGYLAADPQKSPGRTVRWLKIFQQVLAITVFLAILISLMGSVNGSVFRVQVGSGSEVRPEEITVTFDDIKGVDEAKQELKDIVEFLKNPDKFSVLGGKLPKGVLLVGPPGTGKTLLARAVAGEAGVPFFHAAGPEFDEILVGQGARRVRDLFRAAKTKAPCVVFIDEIDSVGAKRTNSVLHPYANQTINQLLSEMDGFHQNEGVIVLGATNRRDDLDKALMRPGRFDVEVQVPTPDYTGRREILEFYLGKVVRAQDVNVDILARGTTGFTGADIENMVNQAALRAAIDAQDSVTMRYFENARDKVLMGPERKSRIPDEEANVITAFHEGGHAIVAYYTKDSHPLHKVTIIPRGPSLGHTAYIPEKERYHVTKSQLLAMMDTMMGGRAAEELIFGLDKITSGASSDLKQATAIATHMVKEWGMSEKVGLRTVEDNNKALVVVNDLSPSVNESIDLEIKRLLQESYERAKTILRGHQKEHKMLAEALLKYETLDADDIKTIMSGKEMDSSSSLKNS